MGNPVRPWRTFLTAWEGLDLAAQNKLISDNARVLRQLRTHRADLDKRIAYWENNQQMAQAAKRGLEFLGRGRERYERTVKPTKTRVNQGRLANVKAKAVRLSEAPRDHA